MSLPFFPHFASRFSVFFFFIPLLRVVYFMCESLCIVLHCFFSFHVFFLRLLSSVYAVYFFLLLVTICLRFILQCVCVIVCVCFGVSVVGTFCISK